MQPGASLMERFDGWFVEPIEKLKEIPESDGGFLAMSASLFLCERYYRALAKINHGRGDDETFKIEAAKDFGLSLDDFKCFWMVFRNGIQHQGVPRKYIDENKVEYTWQLYDDIDAILEFYNINTYKRVIRLNVWKFADLIITKFKTNPKVFQKAFSHTFAVVE